jgi:hypothetical protein
MNTSFETREFAGKRVLVTGGTKSAGKVIAERFQRVGATVIVTARSAPEGESDGHISWSLVTSSLFLISCRGCLISRTLLPGTGDPEKETRNPRQGRAQNTNTSTAASRADFTTSSNFSSFVFGALSLASTCGTDSRKLNSNLLLTA